MMTGYVVTPVNTCRSPKSTTVSIVARRRRKSRSAAPDPVLKNVPDEMYPSRPPGLSSVSPRSKK